MFTTFQFPPKFANEKAVDAAVALTAKLNEPADFELRSAALTLRTHRIKIAASLTGMGFVAELIAALAIPNGLHEAAALLLLLSTIALFVVCAQIFRLHNAFALLKPTDNECLMLLRLTERSEAARLYVHNARLLGGLRMFDLARATRAALTEYQDRYPREIELTNANAFAQLHLQ